MADEFQTGICSGNWWNSSRSAFGSPACSTVINDIGSFGWPGDLLDMKARSSTDESGSVSDSVNSTLQMMGMGLPSSPTTNWNQTLLQESRKAENNYHHPMLEEDMNSRLNYQQQTGIDSSINAFKPINEGFSTSSGDCTATCQGLTTSFPMNSASYGYPSTLLQTLFDTDHHPHPHPQPQQSLFENRSMNDFSPSLPKFSPLPKQQPTSHLHFNFNNNTPFWNASAAAQNDTRASFFPSTPSQFLTSTFEEKPNCSNLTAKRSSEEVQDSSSVVKKSSTEPAFKRTRIETPSPLPTFKVRKEKLGDRITALQQLVSPFGKTDTASVLYEAIEYIKFLHDQVLCTPYMKNGAPIQHQQASDKLKDQEGPKQDLRSRGLCLIPISSTFPVANEPTADFWTPTFGGTFR